MKNKLSVICLLFITLSYISCKDAPEKQNQIGDSTMIKSPEKTQITADADTVKNPAFDKVEELIRQSITGNAFPGAVLLVWKDGRIIFQMPYGHFTYSDSSAAVTTSTIYDLASLTKVLATTTAAMICMDRKLFKLEDKVAVFIPSFSENGKGSITIKNLLMHNSGLPAYKKYYTLYNKPQDVLNDIYSIKLSYATGTKTVYSDLGMITLGKVIESVTGKSLDDFCNTEIFKPLGMNDTYYNPPHALRYRIAPTENDKYWRHRLLIGEVHDETASLLNGVAGHAGLFSTAGDISKLLQMLLQKGIFDGIRLIDPATVALFTSKQSNGRGLGWDIKTAAGSSAGNLFSAKSYGHTGFTGTSVWIDPIKNLFVIFLTNRVYPDRVNNKIIKIRPVLHDLIIKAAER
jgi:CubicO group peptidase (beta-lactamase class C family)